MKYRGKKVKDVPSEQLLFELIKREGQNEAPINTNRQGLHLESIVGIGKDNSAHIVLTDEAYSDLEQMLAE